MIKSKKHSKNVNLGMSSVTDGLILMVAIVFSAILIFVGMSNYTNLVSTDDVTMISRQCIIAMETKGYLDSETKNDTQSQLGQTGCIDIDFHDGIVEAGQRTTTEPVLFGKQIVLHLSVSVPRQNVEVRGLSVVITHSYVPLDIILTSTAKS